MKDKKFYKWIKENTKNLPSEQYVAWAAELKVDKLTGKTKEVFRHREEHEVNHGRMAIKAYRDGGLESLNKYFRARGFDIIPKAVYDQQMKEQQNQSNDITIQK